MKALCMATVTAVLLGPACVALGEASPGAPIRWIPPPTFDKGKRGLGLPGLAGVTHYLIYNPLPSKCNVDEGGSGQYESLRHGTYSHHQRILVHEDKFVVYWTNHSRDENGPGQRLLAKVGTFSDDRTEIDWGGDETLVELAPAPMPVRRRQWTHDADEMYEGYASGALHLTNGRLYVRGSVVACHGWTNEVKYHGMCHRPIPAANWSDGWAPKSGFRWDMWWPLGMGFVQRWRIKGRTLAPDSPMYKLNDPVTQVEVTPSRYKRVPRVVAPYANAAPFGRAAEEMQEDIVQGKRVQFHREPKYAKGTRKLAADGKNGLAHMTEFRRPDGKWVVVRDNLLNPHYYYAAIKDRRGDDYPPAIRTNLYGHVMPVAGELPDGRPWIICNNMSRRDMYLTLSDDGVTFDRTWLLRHAALSRGGGIGRGGGPQYFQSVTIGPNIWVVYSIGKTQIGATKIPIRLFPPRTPDGD